MRSDHPRDSKRHQKIKKASKKKTRPETIHPPEISTDNPKGQNHDKSYLIYVGGNYMGRLDYSENKRTPMKTFKQLREEMAETLITLQEKRANTKANRNGQAQNRLITGRKRFRTSKK